MSSAPPSFKPEAIDLSHHLSEVAKARQTSPLKGLQKYWGRPGLISLAGGLPSPEYFPFTDVSSNVLVANSFPIERDQDSSSFSWLWNLFGGSKERTTFVSVPKYPAHPGDANLATAMQYGMSSGIPQLQKIVQDFSTKVYDPAYSNFVTLVHAGNTDAWHKVVTTLCNPGDGVLVSKWTYPSSMAAMKPYGIKAVPVDIDEQGMRSDQLRTILTEWDPAAHNGMRRPRVIYAVPHGENPTGTTTRVGRKKEIYQICVEFDIILVEDDPYFVLQEGPYVPKSERHRQADAAGMDNEKFIASLQPSYLKFDYQGRVIHLDTFSKTMAPGCRLGWYTCNPMFAERLERASETSTQVPSGLSQSLVTATLQAWGYDGYMRWLKALRLQYTLRRDFIVDCLADEFHLTTAPGLAGTEWEGAQVYHGFAKPQRSLTGYFSNEKSPTLSNRLISFVPPTSGMFVWLKVHFDEHPSLRKFGAESLEMRLWTELAEENVLFGPGVMFSATGDWSSETTGHYRISFSNLENEEMKKAIQIFGKVIRKFMVEL